MFINNIFVTFLLLHFGVELEAVLVQTENGLLDGVLYTTEEGRQVTAFLGVPFARPPVEDLRFAEPQPVRSWKGVRPAHTFSPKCIQINYYRLSKDNIIGEEDCLYLNIFTPFLLNNTKLDVLVFIHGGGFNFGSGDNFRPDFLLDRGDVVFVTINYRLGPFGFLATEDSVIPGNMGLKDQVQALKWIQSNIEHFGGDKSKVTIAGLSSGGASVHFHYLSPLSKNLFHKGISMSGSAFCPWVSAENTHKKAEILATTIGCPTENSESMLECLRIRSAKTLLLQVENLFLPWFFNPFSPFGAVVERPSSSAFLTKNPYDLLKEGKVEDKPWLTSVTTEEGLFPAASFASKKDLLEELDKNWHKIAPHLLDYNHTISPDQLNHISEKIRNFYLAEKKITQESLEELVQMMGDRLFVVDVVRAAKLQAAVTNSPVYFYSFGYKGKYGVGQMFCNCEDQFGTSHGDDMIYILKTGFNIFPLETDNDKAMVDKMVSMWLSFIKSGKPFIGSDIDWKPLPAGGNLTHIMILSYDDIKEINTKDLGNMKFWDSLPFKELWNANGERDQFHDEL